MARIWLCGGVKPSKFGVDLTRKAPMTRVRTAILPAVLVACGLSCSDNAGLGPDGPLFLTVTLNGQPWAVTHGLVNLQDGNFALSATHAVPDSSLAYTVVIAAQPFTGPGSVGVSFDGPGHAGITEDSNGVYTGRGYGSISDTNGTLEISAFRPADSTVAGSLHVRLRHVGGVEPDIDVVAEFRVRPDFGEGTDRQ